MCKDIKTEHGCGCIDFSTEHCKDWYQHRNKEWTCEQSSATDMCEICFRKDKLVTMDKSRGHDDERIRKMLAELENTQRGRLHRQQEQRETAEARERERIWQRDEALHELHEACQSGSESWIEAAVKAVLDHKPKESDGEKTIMQHLQTVQNVLGFNSIEEAYHDIQKRKHANRARDLDDQAEDTEVEGRSARKRRARKAHSK